ncbi:TRAP transporter large permease [Undibacter mobilis]|uniref:TRAP transporter large permease protein n=1 Tax=Undibacter mobilis TaxID=2292256 RepID=A0A371B6W8_9BRAD|nr:TRAP transporter large permease [Undibacter mobilis]
MDRRGPALSPDLDFVSGRRKLRAAPRARRLRRLVQCPAERPAPRIGHGAESSRVRLRLDRIPLRHNLRAGLRLRPDGDDSLHQLLVLPGNANLRLPDHAVLDQGHDRRIAQQGSGRHRRRLGRNRRHGAAPVTLAILGLAFIVLVIVGLPISFAVGVASVIATFLLSGVDNATIVQRMLTAINTFPLLAVIFFVFAGVLMARGGIARRLVMMAEVLVGWLPGSLAQIVCVASMFFGGVTGSAVAEVSSIGSMMIPAMEKDGYSRRFATAIVLMAATMGPIIPPSIGMIVFAHVAGNVSIAALFLAGVIPGVLIGMSLMAASFVHGKLYHRKELPVIPMRDKIIRVIDGMAGVFTMVIILGGIISGIFTATEAGAAAAVYALILTVFVYKEIKISELPEIMWECCLTNAVVMLLIATCSVFSWILTYENLPTLLAENFFNLIQSKWAFLLLLNVFLLIVGMFIDMTPALIMLVPMLIPLAIKFDINMVHLGLIMVINLSFGLTTPPVGTALFVALKVGKISMDKLLPPLLPLLACMSVVLLLVTYVPSIYDWLPRMLGLMK